MVEPSLALEENPFDGECDLRSVGANPVESASDLLQALQAPFVDLDYCIIIEELRQMATVVLSQYKLQRLADQIRVLLFVWCHPIWGVGPRG